MYGLCQSLVTRPAALAALLVLVTIGSGCGGGSGGDRGLGGYDGVMIGRAGPPSAATAAPPPGDDWGEGRLPEQRGRSAGPAASGSGPAARRWSVLLETFTQPGHEAAAANMVSELARVDPRLAAARVHTTDDGSMVVYGRYEDPQDPAAQRDLAWVKSVAIQGRAVFPRAMLTRVREAAPPRALHPFALASARLRYPKVDPLYTMEVAVWGDFGSGALALEEIQQAAEDHCRRLRSQGVEAYFHHDPDAALSSVTVGLFDRRAIDMRSGFYSPEVEALFRRFPAHLVNGEPLRELIDRDRPHLGTKVQTPRLVVVPK